MIFRRFPSLRLKSLLKPLMALGLVLLLALGSADSALAARAGGRVGGGSFRSVPRTSAPAPRSYRGPSGGYYPGGGFGFPFIFPIFGFGGFGGLFGLLLFIGLANFLVRSLRGASDDGSSDYGYTSNNPPVTVAKLQVGLLAGARELQADLNRMATTADTGTSQGLAQLLQEATLSLLRHPEYWVYAATDSSQTRLLAAEQQFNQLTLGERSKFSAETLSNVNSRLQQAEVKALPGEQEPGEYIMATVVVAAQGKLDLPKVQAPQDLRRALSQLGSVSSEQLIAVEILWTPQATGETLSADELVADYPQLHLL